MISSISPLSLLFSWLVDLFSLALLCLTGVHGVSPGDRSGASNFASRFSEELRDSVAIRICQVGTTGDVYSSSVKML